MHPCGWRARERADILPRESGMEKDLLPSCGRGLCRNRGDISLFPRRIYPARRERVDGFTFGESEKSADDGVCMRLLLTLR